MEEAKIKVEKRGHLLLVGLNRPLKRNAFDQQMLDELALAITQLEDEADVRCGVIYAGGVNLGIILVPKSLRQRKRFIVRALTGALVGALIGIWIKEVFLFIIMSLALTVTFGIVEDMY